jgi:murein DD-endopeptidase MepM/ murein hydrolase activator NlpD
MKKNIYTGAFGCAALFVIFYFINPWSSSEEGRIGSGEGLSIEKLSEEEVFRYGLSENQYIFEEGIIKRNENLSQILTGYGVPYATIDALARKSKEVYDVRKLAANKSFTLALTADSLQAKFFIYHASPLMDVVYDLTGDHEIRLEEKEVLRVERELSGVISSSVYETILANGGTDKLVDDFADVFGWKLDFGSIQKNDFVKVIYEELQVDGEAIGTGRIIAAEMNHWGRAIYAYQFDQGDGPDYFDEEGNSLRKAFLRYPVNFSRISSRYNPKRFHPVAKVYRAHLGTDFAAPTGTPIKAAADGVVQAATYTSANGNYVKIKHNATYTTGYLHMSKIASGIKSGTRVKQGQIIGYVGSTGLATGPHLCYRFWKNDTQVDALKVELPPENPITAAYASAYEKAMLSLRVRLDAIPAGLSETVMASAK